MKYNHIRIVKYYSNRKVSSASTRCTSQEGEVHIMGATTEKALSQVITKPLKVVEASSWPSKKTLQNRQIHEQLRFRMTRKYSWDAEYLSHTCERSVNEPTPSDTRLFFLVNVIYAFFSHMCFFLLIPLAHSPVGFWEKAIKLIQTMTHTDNPQINVGFLH